MLVAPSSLGLEASRASLSVLTNPLGTAASRKHALGRQACPREYADGLARWQVVAHVPPRVLPPKDEPLSRWSSSVDHPTCSPSISGDRVYTKIHVGDRVRLRPSAVPPPPADEDDSMSETGSTRLYFGADRSSGDSFGDYVREAGLDRTPNVPSRVDRGTIGLVKLVDLPKRECEVDFAFTRQAKPDSPTGGLGTEESPSPRSRIRMMWHRVKFEELEVCECSDDLDAQGSTIRASMKRTTGRANATLRHTLSTPEIVAQREFQASQREKLEMWQSARAGTTAPTKRRRKKKMEMSANMSHKLQTRLTESGSSEFAAYFQVQQMYSAARAEFAEASSTVRGKSQVLLAVDDDYTDAEITACNVREFHRKAISQLNVALRIEDAASACEALEKVHTLLERIATEQPTFLRVRVGLRKCDTRLEVMRGALMHAEKVQMGRSIHGDKLEEVSLCEIDASEDQLKSVFEMIDADGSGALDRDEIAKLIHYFQDYVPSEQDMSDAMEHMDRDGSGSVEYDEFLWWWRERTAGDDMVRATQQIQSHFRGLSERRQFTEDKYRVIQLQSKVRAKLARKRFIRKRREMFERQAAADAHSLRQGHLAATQIQSIWRGAQARKTVAGTRAEIYFKEMEAASLKIQASYRGLRGRREGETQRSYLNRLYNLNKRAVRMWTNQTVGSVFNDWTEYVEKIRNLRRRSLARMAHAKASSAFDTWYEFAEMCRVDRNQALHELGLDLQEQVARTDPQEIFRGALQGLGRTELELNAAMDEYWTYRRSIVGDPDCGEAWREARLQHYMAWVESTERSRITFEDIPAPPESMMNARAQPKKGLMDKLRKEKSQVARGILLRITATAAAGAGQSSFNVTVEPQQSLNVLAEHGQRLSCALQPDAVTPAAAEEVAPLLDRSGTELSTVWSEASEMPVGASIDESATEAMMLAWAGADCHATFDIANTQTMRISGSLATEDRAVEDCTRPDGSHPTRKVGVFAIGLKDVSEWRRADDADSEGTPVYVKYEWAVVKQPPPALLVRVALDQLVSEDGDGGAAGGSSGGPGVPEWSKGSLSVRVVRAEGLAAGGGGWDMADPYAVVRLSPADWTGRKQMPVQPEPQERKTATMDDTLSPVWDEVVEFTDNILMAPSPDMALFVTSEESEETTQTTLRELRRLVGSGKLSAGSTSVWWPALGRDLLDADGDGDEDELNWIPLAAAHAELGVHVAPEHGLAGATLEVDVMDKDLLTKDDLVARFPPLPLSAVRPLGKARAQDFWLEAGVAVRPPRVGGRGSKKGSKSSAPSSSSSSSSSLVDDPDAVVVARESLVRSVFDQFDTNGNGLLEKDEILALLDGMSEVGPVRLNVASLGEVPDLEAMMAQVDTDGSGEVGFDEFFVWYEEQVAKQERGDDNSLLFRLSRSLG
jgi:Ca2+-binding EF-hand superfamily protein